MHKNAIKNAPSLTYKRDEACKLHGSTQIALMLIHKKVSAARAGCNGPPRRRFAPALGSGKNAAAHKTACTTRRFRGGSLLCGGDAFRLSASWLCQDEDSLFIAHPAREVKRESLGFMFYVAAAAPRHLAARSGSTKRKRKIAQNSLLPNQRPILNRQTLYLYIDITYLCNYTGYTPSEGLGNLLNRFEGIYHEKTDCSSAGHCYGA